jgi:hypothetical protein
MGVRDFLKVGTALGALLLPASAAGAEKPAFVRIPMQYIAALGDPGATEGRGAESWGIWREDPGPRGVWLDEYDTVTQNGGVAPAGWTLDPASWWLEENGLIMEAPTFPLPPRRYLVTGGRDKTAVLTVYPPDADGTARWMLDGGATLHDVTHLGCRSARYTPLQGNSAPGACTPALAPRDAFRVAPGAAMPPIPGCAKQDYHVLFVIGLEAGSSVSNDRGNAR